MRNSPVRKGLSCSQAGMGGRVLSALAASDLAAALAAWKSNRSPTGGREVLPPAAESAPSPFGSAVPSLQ